MSLASKWWGCEVILWRGIGHCGFITMVIDEVSVYMCAGLCAHACVWVCLTSFVFFISFMRHLEAHKEDRGLGVFLSLSILSSIITLKQLNSILFFIISIHHRCQACHAHFTLLQRVSRTACCNPLFPTFLSRYNRSNIMSVLEISLCALFGFQLTFCVIYVMKG